MRACPSGALSSSARIGKTIQPHGHAIAPRRSNLRGGLGRTRSRNSHNHKRCRSGKSGQCTRAARNWIVCSAGCPGTANPRCTEQGHNRTGPRRHPRPCTGLRWCRRDLQRRIRVRNYRRPDSDNRFRKSRGFVCKQGLAWPDTRNSDTRKVDIPRSCWCTPHLCRSRCRLCT